MVKDGRLNDCAGSLCFADDGRRGHGVEVIGDKAGSRNLAGLGQWGEIQTLCQSQAQTSTVKCSCYYLILSVGTVS
jgi:hypothetical protein